MLEVVCGRHLRSLLCGFFGGMSHRFPYGVADLRVNLLGARFGRFACLFNDGGGAVTRLLDDFLDR